MHIANIDYVAMYEKAFDNRQSVIGFINQVERTGGEAKIILHQAARMLYLADRMEECAKGRPALQLLFFIITAELVAKIVNNYPNDGQSRKHVRLFFEQICTWQHRQKLERAFYNIEDNNYLTLRESVDFLYEVRCDVVHRGFYFGFSLKDELPVLTGHNRVRCFAEITIEELRQIVLKGAIEGCKKFL
jgi:hypothetical protein